MGRGKIRRKSKEETLQPKLKVGQPGDKYEQEADAVADKVVSNSADSAVQMSPLGEDESIAMMPDEETLNMQSEEEKLAMSPEGEEKISAKEEDEVALKEEEEISTKKEEELAMSEEEIVSKKDEDEMALKEEEEIKKKPAIQKSGDGSSYASPALTNQISQTKGQGSQLGESAQQELGQKMGADFRDVRIHTDQRAAEMNNALGAKAFAHGQDIYFNQGNYDPGSTAGKRLLAHELTHTMQQSGSVQKQVQLTRLRDWSGDRTIAVSDAQIRASNEYKALMDPSLVWQTKDHVTAQEATKACRLMLSDMRNGVTINWKSDARSYVERARAYYGDVADAAADQRTHLEAAATTAGRSLGEHIHDMAQTGGYGGRPTPWWDGKTPDEQRTWMDDAELTIESVIASLAGTEMEAMVDKRGIVASPRQCEAYGAFAYFSHRDNKLHVGRSWIEKAERDPTLVFDNIVHELGGHFEYEGNMGDDIMDRVLDGMSAAERAKANAGPKSVYSTFAYMETEIFAELREMETRQAESGGDEPSVDVPRQLRRIKDRFEPGVAEMIVKNLREKVQAASNITSEAKVFFDEQIIDVFGALP